jgi:hypothetical protein
MIKNQKSLRRSISDLPCMVSACGGGRKGQVSLSQHISLPRPLGFGASSNHFETLEIRGSVRGEDMRRINSVDMI